MKLKYLQWIFLLTLYANLLWAQTGPGGVGSSTSNRFWYTADDLSPNLSDGNSVSDWYNKGGYGNSANQGAAANQPTFGDNAGAQMNGLPVLQFDGTGDRLLIQSNTDLDAGGALATRSFVVVFRTSADITSRQVIYEEGGGTRGLDIYIFNGLLYVAGWNLASDGPGAPWGFSFTNTAIATNTDYIVSFIKNGNTTTTGTINGYLNGQNFGTIANVGQLYNHNPGVIGGMDNGGYFETGSAGGNGNYFSGDISEFIHYNLALNNAQRILVENYLAAKYGITLTVSDIYTMDNAANGDYDFEVAGIGQASDATNSTNGQGSSFIRIDNPGALVNNEFLIWGHDDGTLNQTSSTVPASVDYRLERIWRVSENSDVGTVDIDFDLTKTKVITVGIDLADYTLLVDGTDADFSDITPISATALTGNILTFNGVDFADGDRFTLGINNSSTCTDGPGGVGLPADYRFRFEANTLSASLSDGDAVNTWTNTGGNSLDATSPGASDPFFRNNATDNMNGFPVIDFNGVDQWFTITDNSDLNTGAVQSQRSFVMVIRTSADITSRQVLYEEGGTARGLNIYIFNGDLYWGAWNIARDGPGSLWNFNSVNTAIATDSEYIISFIKRGNDAVSGFVDAYLNGQLVGSVDLVGFLYSHGSDIGIGAMDNDTFFESGGSSGDDHRFQGQIADFVHYNYALNNAQRAIIENALSAQYDIGLSASDHYTMDNAANGDYDFEVAGIGQHSDGTQHLNARGTDIVKVNSPDNLSNNEYLIWGNNNQPLSGFDDVDVDGTVIEIRLARVWRAGEVGNVGLVDVVVDLSSFSPINAADIRLMIDRDGDGFADNDISPQSGIASGSSIVFSAVELQDGDFFTIGSVDQTTSPLPIELLSFEVKALEDVVEIMWATASEENNDFFTIERSADAQEFVPVFTVPGAGNSDVVLNYRILDENPLFGRSFYRLKQTDFDGSFSYSEIESVWVYPQQTITTYPNPVVDKLIIQVSGLEQDLTARLSDIHGHEVMVFTIPQSDIVREIQVNLSRRPAGLYLLRFDERPLFISKILVW